MIAKFNGNDTEKADIANLLQAMASAATHLRLRERNKEQTEECWRIACELDKFRLFIEQNNSEEDSETPIEGEFIDSLLEQDEEYVQSSPIKHIFIGGSEEPFECDCGNIDFEMLEADVFKCLGCHVQFRTNTKKQKGTV